MNDTCEWKEDHDGSYDFWMTSCGHAYNFEAGDPCENNFDYCPFCGKKIKLEDEQ
jgi:hypothetical protein